ncbi:hypothetical protein MMPV_005544 [Pyropia vietnamensis]
MTPSAGGEAAAAAAGGVPPPHAAALPRRLSARLRARAASVPPRATSSGETTATLRAASLAISPRCNGGDGAGAIVALGVDDAVLCLASGKLGAAPTDDDHAAGDDGPLLTPASPVAATGLLSPNSTALAAETTRTWLRREAHHAPSAFYLTTVQGGAVTTADRTRLVDFLIEATTSMRLTDTTTYLAVATFDRYLSTVAVPGGEGLMTRLRLLGVAAILVASKYHERSYRDPALLAAWAGGDATSRAVLAAERSLLGALSYHLTVPHVGTFASRLLDALAASDHTRAATAYALDIAVADYRCLVWRPSMLAAAAVRLAAAATGETRWGATADVAVGAPRVAVDMVAAAIEARLVAAAGGGGGTRGNVTHIVDKHAGGKWAVAGTGGVFGVPALAQRTGVDVAAWAAAAAEANAPTNGSGGSRRSDGHGGGGGRNPIDHRLPPPEGCVAPKAATAVPPPPPPPVATPPLAATETVAEPRGTFAAAAAAVAAAVRLASPPPPAVTETAASPPGTSAGEAAPRGVFAAAAAAVAAAVRLASPPTALPSPQVHGPGGGDARGGATGGDDDGAGRGGVPTWKAPLLSDADNCSAESTARRSVTATGGSGNRSGSAGGDWSTDSGIWTALPSGDGHCGGGGGGGANGWTTDSGVWVALPPTIAAAGEVTPNDNDGAAGFGGSSVSNGGGSSSGSSSGSGGPSLLSTSSKGLPPVGLSTSPPAYGAANTTLADLLQAAYGGNGDDDGSGSGNGSGSGSDGN